MLNFLKELLFPAACLGCGREGTYICAACFRCLRFSGGQVDELSGSELEAVAAAGNYSDHLLGEAIRRYKFGSVPALAAPLGDFLSAFFSGSLILNPELRYFIIVPIPLSQRRLRERGFNQAAKLAQRVADNLGLSLENSLVRLRHSRPQSTLSGPDRRRNLAGAFVWRGRPAAGRSFLLLDDVVTTGATLREAARALRQAGAGRVRGLALARADALHFPLGEV